MTVRKRLDALEEQIQLLKNDQARVIADEPPTFEHLPEKPNPSRYSRQRYFVVFADGSLPRYSYPMTQRPAALKVARKGRYIWDIRENVVLDGEGNVVHRGDD